jgi:acylphosphatase
MAEKIRAEIIASGLVQGVGFRYFVHRNATALGLKGYTKNLFTGDVLTVVEGEPYLVEQLIEKIKIGPHRSQVRQVKVNKDKFTNEFKTFEVRY